MVAMTINVGITLGTMMLEERAARKDLADLRAKLGLDRPIYVQYVQWFCATEMVAPRMGRRFAHHPEGRAAGHRSSQAAANRPP